LEFGLELFFETVRPLFEAATLMDQLNTVLVEPTNDTLESVNVLL
jgi:hypothetical protein